MEAPLTGAKLGSTRCVGCERPFASTPDLSITETVAEVENRGRVDSIGQLHRGIGTHAVTRRWHTRCLEEFEAANAAYRARVEADRVEMLRSICAASGLDFDTEMAKRAARQDAEAS